MASGAPNASTANAAPMLDVYVRPVAGYRHRPSGHRDSRVRRVRNTIAALIPAAIEAAGRPMEDAGSRARLTSLAHSHRAADVWVMRVDQRRSRSLRYVGAAEEETALPPRRRQRARGAAPTCKNGGRRAGAETARDEPSVSETGSRSHPPPEAQAHRSVAPP
jgi:hypothetical protein